MKNLRPVPLGDGEGFDTFSSCLRWARKIGTTQSQALWSGDTSSQLHSRLPAAMGDPAPSWMTQVVGKLIGAGHLLDKLIKALANRLRVTRDDRGTPPAERHSRRVICALLAFLAAGLNPVTGFTELTLLTVKQAGDVHLLHSLISVPVGVCSTARRLFACIGEFPIKGLSAVVAANYFAVRHVVHAVPRANLIIHLEGITLLAWQ